MVVTMMVAVVAAWREQLRDHFWILVLGFIALAAEAALIRRGIRLFAPRRVRESKRTELKQHDS